MPNTTSPPAPTRPIDRPIVDPVSNPRHVVKKMIVLWILAAIAVWGYPRMMLDVRPQFTSEAGVNVRALYDSSVAYFEEYHQFPDSHATWPAEAQGGEKYENTTWDAPTWVALRFTTSPRHYFQYQYDSTNDLSDPGRSTFTASAFADFDGDGTFSTFVRFGSVRGLQVIGPADMYVDRPGE
ncbi:MAG: type II secretory pathway pseudopilin PulG [Flavobacteriales bacterium]|jgi:type II secretory pathway pseudopilin PulG